MVAGKDAFRPGEGKNSWLTGTAAWNWFTISQYILGIKPTYYGLSIDPCLSSDMKGYIVKRKFRGATYIINVQNPEGRHNGISILTVDGLPVDGNVIPIQKAGSIVHVTVRM
jgi:cellobiose phosphorylase